MPDIITLTGLVATNPRHILTSEGLSITSFRLASTQRRFDRSVERWIDGETNWYTITSFRQLALNSSISVEKGQRVLVTGKLRIREWDNGERVGTTIDIEAESIGHDLAWGTAKFTRSIMSSPSVPVESVHVESVPVEHDAAAPEGGELGHEHEHDEHSDHDVEAEARLAVEPAVPF